MMSELIVIGAGLPRTGTTSTKAALEHLLGGECYHLRSIEWAPKEKAYERGNFWTGIQTGSIPPKPEYFRDHYGKDGFVAAVDFPSCHYYKELMEAFPNAKVLLTVREPEKWYQSALTLYHMEYAVPRQWPYSWMKYWLFWSNVAYQTNPKMYEALGKGEEAAVKFFNDWVEEVKRYVPSDRLLVFSVKEGWEPLCKFLGLPVPDIPYPNTNDSKELKNSLRQMKLEAWGYVAVVSAALVGVTSAVVRYTNIGKMISQRLF